jgi:hypothetical protein
VVAAECHELIDNTDGDHDREGVQALIGDFVVKDDPDGRRGAE